MNSWRVYLRDEDGLLALVTSSPSKDIAVTRAMSILEHVGYGPSLISKYIRENKLIITDRHLSYTYKL